MRDSLGILIPANTEKGQGGTINGVTGAKININPAKCDQSGTMNDANSVRDVILHELGHTFGLKDCYDCKIFAPTTDTVLTALNTPPYNWQHPQTCDIEQSYKGGFYCLPSLVCGGSASGTLATTDAISTTRSGCYADRFVVQLTSGSPYTISVFGSFDTYAVLLFPAGGVASQNDNDPSTPGTTNSKISFSAIQGGQYVIEVTSKTAGALGSYSVTFVCGQTPPPPGPGDQENQCGTVIINPGGGSQKRCGPSPVIIDLAGDGFALTNQPDGVKFDLNADGTAEFISWTAAGEDDGWLALDRDGNGSIDSGRELFGNVTLQPDGTELNGYRALAVFDGVDFNGNADGVITNADAVYAFLRVWVDNNHDGVSQGAELLDLPTVGVTAISLSYSENKIFDQFGNWFRYSAPAYQNGQVRQTYDVFLLPAY